MAYWGIAMCQPGFSSATGNSEWVNAIDKALSLSQDVSSIEKALIQSTAVLIKKGIGQAEMEYRKLYQNFPKEPEAIAFASIILRQYPSPKIQEEVKILLEKALVQFPDKTALQHYYIHIMELDARFSKAIPFAEKMIEIAPNSPHLMHMPGHLYYLKGNYEQAIAVFSKAKTQEEIYHRTEHIPFIANQNYMHNIQFLTVVLAEQGKYNLALKTAERLTNIQLNTKAEDINTLFLVYEGRLLPILVHFRFQEWEAGIKKLKTLLNFAWVETKYPPVFSYLNCLKFYAQGMLAVERGDNHAAIESVKKLTEHLMEFEQRGMQTQGTISFRVVNETHDIINMSRYELAGWIDNMDTKKPFKPMAWENAISLEQVIRYDEPPRLLYPISESLGRLHIKRGEIEQAKKAFQLALKKRPNSPIIKELIEMIPSN